MTRRLLVTGIARLHRVLTVAFSTNKIIVNSYSNPSYTQSLQRVVVVGIGNNRDSLAQLETAMVKALQDTAINALSASAKFDNPAMLDKESIVKMATSYSADAVLIMRVKSIGTHAVAIEENNRSNSRTIDDTINNHRVTDALALQYSALLSTKVFSVNDGELMWSIDTSTTPQENQQDA